MLPIRLGCLLSLLIGSSAASAITIDWTFVGNPGNACLNLGQPIGCVGSVPYAYRIGTYEVTNAQYAGFLNSVAATDTFLVYNTLMDTDTQGGITRTGSTGSYSYAAKPGAENEPVNFVSYHSALRFVNWLDNGQPIGMQDATTTEGGAYTFTSRTEVSQRNPGATVFLPSEDEWVKAAYYDSARDRFYQMPGGFDAMGCSSPTTTPNRANCQRYELGLVDVGSYPNSPSPYGTFDQAGNVSEWNERREGTQVFHRGGAYSGSVNDMYVYYRFYTVDGNLVGSFFGFRVAMIPEPTTGLLVIAGLLGFGVRRRIRA